MFDDGLSLHRLGEAHRSLLADLSVVDDLADQLLRTGGAIDPEGVDDALRVLRGRLGTHMAFEEQTVYPVLAAEAGSAGAMDWMIEDHREIRRWTDELTAWRAQMDAEDPCAAEHLRRALYVLSALVNLHLRKEETAYAWLLERRLEPHGLEAR